MRVEIDMLFVLNIVMHTIRLVGLDKLGSMFYPKRRLSQVNIFAFGTTYDYGNFSKRQLHGSSVVQQSLLILFFFLIFRGNCWEKIRLFKCPDCCLGICMEWNVIRIVNWCHHLRKTGQRRYIFHNDTFHCDTRSLHVSAF